MIFGIIGGLALASGLVALIFWALPAACVALMPREPDTDELAVRRARRKAQVRWLRAQEAARERLVAWEVDDE